VLPSKRTSSKTKKMKPTLVLLTLASCFLASLHAIPTGASAPAFSLTDTSGKTHSLADYAGHYVVLEWTNHKCPIVKKFYRQGHMQALQKEMTAKGVIWLQVVSSAPGKQGYLTAAEGESLRQEKGMASTAMLLDPSGNVGRSYGAKTTPHAFLIDPQGLLIYQGAMDSIRGGKTADIARAEPYLKNAILAALAGAAIDPATTRPYGCGVKY
jgi:hypothetical protein